MSFCSDYGAVEIRLVEMNVRIQDALRQLRIDDMTPERAMLVARLDHERFVGELERDGIYVGTNCSYSVRKLVDTGYVETREAEADRRRICVRRTAKGEEFAASLLAELERS